MEAHTQPPQAWEPQPTPQSAPQSESAVVSRNLNRYNICTNCSGNSYEKNRDRYDRPATSATKWGFFAVHRLGASVTHAPKSRPRQPATAQSRLRCDDRYLPLGNTSCHTVPKLASYGHVTNVTGPRYKKLFLRYEWCAIPATMAGCIPPPLDARTPFLLP